MYWCQVFGGYNFYTMQRFLLLLLLIGPPVPRQASQTRATARTRTSNDSAPEHKDSQTLAPPAQLNASPENKEADKKQAKEDQSQSVSIRKLPAVSISKDWADWGVWAFSFLLVVVGGFQVYFLYRTLEAIKRQADAMDAQLQAMKGKDRGRLRLDLAQPDTNPVLLKTMGGVTLYCLPLKIIVEGGSEATIIESKELCRICIRDTLPSPGKLINSSWPRVINPALGPHQHISTVFIEGADNITGANQNYAEELRLGKRYFLYEASFRYRDVFNDVWVVRVKRKFNFVLVPDYVRAVLNPEILTGRWDDTGEPQDNSEVRQNPN